MIIGVGVDIVLHSRIVEIGVEKMAQRMLSEKEKTYYDTITNEARKIEYVASRFAAKEALFKALDEHIFKNFSEVSVINSEDGNPFFLFAKSENFSIHLSLSHEKDQSIAFVVIEGV